MKMYEVEVSANKDGEILIIQPSYGNDDRVISLAPEQVETLIEWLKAMRDTVLSDEISSEKQESSKRAE